MDSQCNIYWLDQYDSIVKTAGDWDNFAKDNLGENMLSEKIVGRKIWEFVAGDPTRIWLNTLFGYIRIHKKTLVRLYRCDSPNEKRFMEMNLSMEDLLIRVCHSVKNIEKIQPPVKFEYQPLKSLGFKQRCSICNRTLIKTKWVEPGELLEIEGETTGPIRVIYSVCMDCKLLLPSSNSQ